MNNKCGKKVISAMEKNKAKRRFRRVCGRREGLTMGMHGGGAY